VCNPLSKCIRRFLAVSNSAGYTDTGQVLGVDLHVKTLGLCVPCMGYALVFQAYETALEGDVRLRLRAMSLKHMVRHIGFRSSKYKYGAQSQSKVLLVILNFPISPLQYTAETHRH